MAKDKPATGTDPAAGQQGVENPNEEDENAAPSEATVIIEDEPPKKVIYFLSKLIVQFQWI